MNNSFSLQHISKTGNLDSNLISRQYNLNTMARLMNIKFKNPPLKQSERAKELGCSFSILKRYRKGMHMVSPYRIQSNINNKRS